MLGWIQRYTEFSPIVKSRSGFEDIYKRMKIAFVLGSFQIT